MAKTIPALSFMEAQASIDARGTLLQGVHAAFEPFLRSPRMKASPRRLSSVCARSSYDITVSYRGKRTIKSLLKAGNYDWANTDVSDRHFPQTKKGEQKVRIRLINFRRVISSRDVLTKLKARCLRPANPAELLAFGAANPHIQKQFPIIALGQTWRLANGDRLVVCLAWHSMLRRIHLLCQFRRDWPVHCRFAAVSIKPPKTKRLITRAPLHS